MGCVAEVRARLQLDFARRGLPLGDLACVALAAVEALARHPLLNGMWHDGYLILRRRVHLAVARANGATVTLPDAQDRQRRSGRTNATTAVPAPVATTPRAAPLRTFAAVRRPSSRSRAVSSAQYVRAAATEPA